MQDIGFSILVIGLYVLKHIKLNLINGHISWTLVYLFTALSELLYISSNLALHKSPTMMYSLFHLSKGLSMPYVNFVDDVTFKSLVGELLKLGKEAKSKAIVGRTKHCNKDFSLFDFSSLRISHWYFGTCIIHKQPIPRSMRLTHAHTERATPNSVMLTETAVLDSIRVNGFVLLPE